MRRPELAGRVKHGAAQVLQQAQAVAGHGQAASAAGGPVQDGPDQGEAGGLAGQAVDDLADLAQPGSRWPDSAPEGTVSAHSAVAHKP